MDSFGLLYLREVNAPTSNTWHAFIVTRQTAIVINASIATEYIKRLAHLAQPVDCMSYELGQGLSSVALGHPYGLCQIPPVGQLQNDSSVFAIGVYRNTLPIISG